MSISVHVSEVYDAQREDVTDGRTSRCARTADEPGLDDFIF